MNYQESLNLLTSQEKFHINLGLERMKKLAEIFSNPQNDLKIIHVAGTNGKGSTCAMLAKILEDNGYKTGLFTSPHIKKYNERIKINFEDISDNDFSDYMERVENTAKSANISLTEFEILTMMAFLYFKEQKVDFAVIETGLGGRLDATNIINSPILSIITSISLDHTDRLGTNISEIATEKAGIIKTNTPVLISNKNLGFNIIKSTAKNTNSKLIIAEKDFELTNHKENIFSNGEKSFKLALLGKNQGENLALVIKACDFLNLETKNALEKVNWNARFEYLKEKNLILDAGHNADGIKLLKENLNTYFYGQNRAYLFGMLNTKDYKTAIKNLFQPEDIVFVVDNFAHNAIKKEILEKEIRNNFKNIKVQTIELENIKTFIDMKFSGIKICCGSFYIISKVF